jgi:hypothetical protein
MEHVLALKEFALKRSELFLYSGIEVDIDIEEGSVKNRITILGTLAGLYAGIATYSTFRESVILAYSDAKRFSEYLTSESMFTFKARTGDIIRIEARVGVIGSLNKIVTKLDVIQRELEVGRELSRLNKGLQNVRYDIEKLISVLNDEPDINLVKSGFLEMAKTLPANPRNPDKGTHSAQDLTMYDDRRKKLLAVLR